MRGEEKRTHSDDRERNAGVVSVPSFLFSSLLYRTLQHYVDWMEAVGEGLAFMSWPVLPPIHPHQEEKMSSEPTLQQQQQQHLVKGQNYSGVMYLPHSSSRLILFSINCLVPSDCTIRRLFMARGLKLVISPHFLISPHHELPSVKPLRRDRGTNFPLVTCI